MSFNAKDMTQGGQIASMRIRMFSQIANIMLYCLFIFFWILVGLVLWVKISWQTFVNGCIYWWCTTLEGMRDLIKSQPVYEIQYYGKTFRMNAAQVLHDKYMIWCGEQLWSAFVLATVVALVICLIPALNLATSDAAAVAGLVMTVLTVGLVSCAGKSLPRFWPGDFFPTFYACHLAVLGVLAL